MTRRVYSWDALKESTIWDLLGNGNMMGGWVSYRGVHAIKLGNRIFVWAGATGHWTTPPHNRVINNPCGKPLLDHARDLFESVLGRMDPNVSLAVRLKWISG